MLKVFRVSCGISKIKLQYDKLQFYFFKTSIAFGTVFKIFITLNYFIIFSWRCFIWNSNLGPATSP